MIDANVYLSRWPFRRLPGDEPSALAAKLARDGIMQAWAGSFDALFHRDIEGVNRRLVEDCKTHGPRLLAPFGSVNLTLPDWQEDLRRCHEVFRMAGIRLHPNYHGYTLDHPSFATLLEQAARRGLAVQLALSMEDERSQHPLFRVPHVDFRPLIELVKNLPKLRLMILNAFRAMRPDQASSLASAGKVWFDIAMLEGAAGVANLIKLIGVDRVVFGSFFPMFHLESALLKLRESDLGGAELARITTGNARDFLDATS
jgi:hypothetical protein